MSDPQNLTPSAWAKVYHPSGVEITVPLALDSPITSDQGLLLMSSVSALLLAGFSAERAGAEAGELVESVISVARRDGADGVPIVAFFQEHPRLLKKFLHKYLDMPADIAEFECATGLKLANIPVFESDKDVTKDHRQAGKYIIPLPRPIKLAYRISTKWTQWSEGDKQGQQPQKHELLRYITDGPAPQPAPLGPPSASMTIDEARKVKTPQGVELGKLADEKLQILATGVQVWITPEMKAAAQIILKSKGK